MPVAATTADMTISTLVMVLSFIGVDDQVITSILLNTACTEAAIAATKDTHLFAVKSAQPRSRLHASPAVLQLWRSVCVCRAPACVLFCEAGGALTTGSVFPAAGDNNIIMLQSQSVTLR